MAFIGFHNDEEDVESCINYVFDDLFREVECTADEEVFYIEKISHLVWHIVDLLHFMGAMNRESAYLEFQCKHYCPQTHIVQITATPIGIEYGYSLPNIPDSNTLSHNNYFIPADSKL